MSVASLASDSEDPVPCAHPALTCEQLSQAHSCRERPVIDPASCRVPCQCLRHVL